jgi:PAS domain S-box-containing protein
MTPTADIGYHPARVLIVDDERHNRQLLEVMLLPEGFTLVSAGSGQEALAMVAEEQPDLILLDIMMPGMDGYQVAAALKANLTTTSIPIIMITALDDRDARMRGLNEGAEEFLTKPVDRAELCVRVRNLLRLKAYGDYYDKYSQMLEGEVVTRTKDLVERTKQASVLSEQAALLDLAQDAIVARDMRGRVLFWNRGAETMYGWPSGEVIGKRTDALLMSEYPEPSPDIDAALLRRGHWEGETIHYKRDGHRLIVSSRSALQRDAMGAPFRVLTIDTDITRHKQSERERDMLADRLSLATSVARIGVWEWDLASDTLMWDATTFEIYGIPAVVPMHRSKWLAAVRADDVKTVEDAMQRTITEKGQGSGEYGITLPDGSIRHVASVHRAVLDEDGDTVRVIGVDMDVTDRVEAERALEHLRQDQLKFKDDFLSHVSHELRSPLTAIKQFSSILLGGLAGGLNDEQREYQGIVLKNVKQLQAMIDDLLEVTRLETGKLTVELASVLVADAVLDSFNTLQMTAHAKGVRLTYDIPADLPAALADMTRLRQILIILLDNAIKFTPVGGTAHVSVQVLERDSRFLLLEITDSGCGISPEMATRIFERLYQEPGQTNASRKGLGLGLYICKELVTRHGGHIWVEPHQPIGTTFSFTLPAFSLENHTALEMIPS